MHLHLTDASVPCQCMCRPPHPTGLLQLGVSYYQSVKGAYDGVMQTHIVGLIITIILMAGFSFFILWPFVSACRSEGRRIADLLSQLPPDIDVEGLVRRALAGSQPNNGNASGASLAGALDARRVSGASMRNEGGAAPSALLLQGVDGSFYKGASKGARRGSVTIV